jgi:hypothetical protein
MAHSEKVCKRVCTKNMARNSSVSDHIFYTVNSAACLFQAAQLIIFPALLDVRGIEQFQRHMAHFPLAVFLAVFVKLKP